MRALEALWGDEHEAAALRGLREYLTGAGGGRRNYQAPVSYRILPRVLGHAHRALAQAERAAATSLASASDNPVYIPPDETHPYGRCISTGGYHNAMASPALDDLAAIWADLCLLADRHGSKLLIGRVSLLPDLLLVGREASDADGHGNVGYIPMAVTGYLEEAKAAAQRTFIPGSESAGAGQDDVASPVFLAWAKEVRAGRCFDAALAGLAAVASQALHVTERKPPPPLRGFVEALRELVPPVGADRLLGPELERLANSFTARVFARGDSMNAPRQSLRGFLARLEGQGQLLRIAELVDPRFEVSAVLQQAWDGPAVLFDSLRDSELKLIGNVLNSEARFADALGVSQVGLQPVSSIPSTTLCPRAWSNPVPARRSRRTHRIWRACPSRIFSKARAGPISPRAPSSRRTASPRHATSPSPG